MKNGIAWLIVALGMVGGAVACGSSSSGGSGGAGGCSGSGAGGSTCTAYTSCVQSKCGAQQSQCESGPCASYISCASKCGCNNTSCLQGCSLSSDCESCFQTVAACGQQNCASEAQSCAGTGGSSGTGGTGAGGTGGTGGYTCADLSTCCSSASFPAANKSACDQLVQTANDSYCSSAYTGFKAAGYCQ